METYDGPLAAGHFPFLVPGNYHPTLSMPFPLQVKSHRRSLNNWLILFGMIPQCLSFGIISYKDFSLINL